MRFFKVTNNSEVHHGFVYKDGYNEDHLPFQDTGNCCPGGLYFTDERSVHMFLEYGVWLREVYVPEGIPQARDSPTYSYLRQLVGA